MILPRAFVVLLFAALPLSAAPTPAAQDPKPKPRAKLLGTLTLDVQVNTALWTPDGKHLVLATPDKLMVYPREAIGRDEKPKPVAELDRPDDRGRGEVGLTPDGGVYVYSPAGSRVNAENRIYKWKWDTLLAGGSPKADRVIDLEADNPNGLVWAADGKSVYAQRMIARAVPAPGGGFGRQVSEYLPQFLRIRLATGDTVKTVEFSDLSQEKFAGAAFDPSTGRLYLATATDGQTTVTCREADGGKQVWAKALPAKPSLNDTGRFLLSPDGGRLAFVQPKLVVNPPDGNGGFPGGGFGGPRGGRPGQPPPVSYSAASELVLLDAETGDTGVELSKSEQRGAQAHAFSNDGRLLIGSITNSDGGKLVVWDTKSGDELKVWSRGHSNLSAEFSPSGYELAIVERSTNRVYGPQTSSDLPAPLLRTEYTTVLGIWDFAPLVK